ncbi:MAG TPA: FAD-binding protein [Syntrophorhabdales bacterium]|nr:FAD-binding protein [Syntrophorhabdales bacterium]
MAERKKKPRGKATLIPAACIACGKCESVCPVGAIRYDEKGEPVIEFDKCIGCGKCVKACPASALKMAYPEGETVVVEAEPEKEEKKTGPEGAKQWKGVWVFVEQRRGKAHPVSWQLLGKGRTLASDLSEDLSAVILGSGTDGLVENAFGYGATNVYVIDDGVLQDYRTQTYAESLIALCRKYSPEILLIGATAVGRDLASAVATGLETGLTADCTQLAIDKETRLLDQTRPAFGGNIMATIICERARPQMASVRPDVFPLPPYGQGTKGKVFKEALPDSGKPLLTKVLEITPIEKRGVDVAAAEVVVSGGRGMTSREHFGMLEELASLLGGTVAGTRSAVDAGWVGYERQVGQTGKTVRPKLYVACGVSGAIQHLVGMQSAEYVIAINRDPHAPIFEVADLGIVGDLFEIVPGLIEALKKKKRTGEVSWA